MRPEGITQGQYNFYLVLEHFLGLKLSEKIIRPKRNRLYAEVLKNKGIENRGETIPTASITYYDFKPFENNKPALLDKPYLFKGVAKEWPAIKTWNKQFFREKYGDIEIPLVDKIPGIRDDKGRYGKINFKQYFDEVDKGSNIYLSFSRVLDNNPELLKDLDLNWLRQFEWGAVNGEQTFFFMGEEGTKTDMHNGFAQTLFIQVEGRKKWTIWAPEERFFLDPVAGRHTHFYSFVNPHEENDPRYPLLKYAKKYELELEAGDVLWFPALFWHYVENPTSNIGVAFKWVNVPQNFKISKLLTTLVLLATNPSLI
jgi:hypothetical protein